MSSHSHRFGADTNAHQVHPLDGRGYVDAPHGRGLRFPDEHGDAVTDYATINGRTAVPVLDFSFPTGTAIGDMYTLTCINHPTAKYLTKSPYERGLHFVEGPAETPFRECECPFRDMVVLIDNGQHPQPLSTKATLA